MNPKQQAQLEKRSKELDAREEYLNKWERQLKQAPIDIKVLNETIKVKTAQLGRIRRDISDSDKLHEQQIKRLEIAENSLKALQFKNQQLIEEQKAIEKRHKTDISGLKKQKLALEAEVKDRTTYRREQEQIINQVISDGNLEITGLNIEIKSLLQKKQQVIDDLPAIEAEITDLQFRLTTTEDQWVAEQENARQILANIEDEIHSAKIKLGATRQQDLKVKADTDAKLAKLKLKEEELLAKREAINLDRANLEEDKRRWTSAKSLYEV